MTALLISLSFFVLSGIAKAFMDISAIDRFIGKGFWWNKSFGWKYKWKLSEKGFAMDSKKAPWYYFGLHKPHSIERFPYSSTLLVAATDFWHLSQFCFLTFVALAVAVISPWQPFDNYWLSLLTNVAVVKAGITVPFQIVYSYITKK